MRERIQVILKPDKPIFKITANSVNYNTIFMSMNRPVVGETVFLSGNDYYIDYVTQLTDVGTMYLTDMYYKDEEGTAKVAELYTEIINISIVMTKV